jgi:hypothetical protein
MVRVALFAVAMSTTTCGGKIAGADDAGLPSVPPQSSAGTVGGLGTGAGPSSGGPSPGGAPAMGSSAASSSAAPPMSGENASGLDPADAAELPSVPDAAVAMTTGDAGPVRCTLEFAGGVGGDGGGAPVACRVSALETCSGVDYSVVCSCPQGSCTCTGRATSFVALPGCPFCPSVSQLFALCGFPQ